MPNYCHKYYKYNYNIYTYLLLIYAQLCREIYTIIDIKYAIFATNSSTICTRMAILIPGEFSSNLCLFPPEL